MAAAACLTLAAVYFFIWIQGKQRKAYLFFALTAAGSAANAFFEMLLLQTTTVAVYHLLIRWEVLAVGLIMFGLVCSVRLHFGTGRLWLAWTIVALWGAC
jgi:hypothetical protein